MQCKKATFLTKDEAIKRVGEIQGKRGKNVKPIRSYKCDKCGYFHLTSWSKKRKKEVESGKVFKHINKFEDEAEYWEKKKGWD